MDFDNMWKSMGANVNTPGPVEQATRGDFRISGTTITKYIGKKVKLRLPDGITTIGENAFAINDNIDTVVIPEGVTRIESGGFATNRSLVKVDFPSSLKYIGPGAFMYCSLREVNLPEGLEEIDDQAFMNCRNIKGIKVPESVVRIGDYAFSNMGLPLMSEPGTLGATVLLHENLRGIIDEESVAGATKINFKYYGVKNRDLSKFQNKNNDNYDEEHQISELSGQSVSIAGGKYDHDFDDNIPEGVVFKLPNGYKIEKFINEEGEGGIFLGGEYKYNDAGEPAPNFQYNFININVNITNREEAIKAGKISAIYEPGTILDYVVQSMIDSLSENAPVNKESKINRDYPATTAVNIYKPISIFGRTIHSYALMIMFEIGEESCFGLQTTYIYREEDGNDEFFDSLYKVLKSISINNECINLPLNAKNLEKIVHFDADENAESLEIPINFGINLKVGDEETSFTYNSDGSVSSTRVDTALGFAYPDSSLTPHMDQIGMAGGLGFLPGVKVVVNQTGTEYEFHQLDDYAYLDDDADTYKLAEAAEIMSEVFRVNENVFDEKHDRESEIKENYLHRAYMMSALRSFAWTLAKYCDDLECNPDSLNIEQIEKIVDHVAGSGWKNYDGDSYCKGLCGTQDLHVYYMPDSTPSNIISRLMPSQSDIEEVDRTREKFPTYNPILSTVGSLDELRKDLLYIYPAIKTLYENILESRDHSVPLDSSDGDILYAWCAMARAARGPFFSEDGPMNCWFSREETDSWQSIDDLGISTNPDFIIEDGELVEYKGSASRIIIPDSVDIIGEDAFYANKELKSVTISCMTDSVNDSAFCWCSNLEEIKFEGDLEEIGEYAFADCESIKIFNFPDSVDEIGDYVLCRCKNLKEIHMPSSFYSISDDAFESIPSDAVFFVDEGSEAEEFCQDNGYNYKYNTYGVTTDYSTSDDRNDYNGSNDNMSHENNISVSELNVNETIQSARESLETYMYADAIRKCEGILDYDPNNAEAYLLKMLAECKCKSIDDLIISAEDFWENKNYKFINRFGDESIIGKLNDCKKQCEEIRNKRRFRYALGLLEKCDRQSLIEASEIFEELGTLLCAKELRKECEYKIAKHFLYNEENDAIVIRHLENAGDYANAVEMIREINEKILEREKEAEQKDYDEKKKLFDLSDDLIKEGSVESLKKAIETLEILKKRDSTFFDCEKVLESTKIAVEKILEDKEAQANEKRYVEVLELMEQENIESLSKAINIITTIWRYKDTEELKHKCEEIRSRLITEKEARENKSKYDKAIMLMEEATPASLDRAITLFAELGDYSNAVEKCSACRDLKKKIADATDTVYDEAKKLMNSYNTLVAKRGKLHSEKFEEQMACLRDMNSAIEIFEEIGDYKDAVSNLAKCRLQREEIRDLVGKRQYMLIHSKYSRIPNIEKIDGTKWIEWLKQICDAQTEFIEIDFVDDARRKTEDIDDRKTELLSIIECKVNDERKHGYEYGAWVLLQKYKIYKATLEAFGDWGNANAVLKKCEAVIDDLSHEVTEVSELSGISIKDMNSEKKAYSSIYHDATKVYKKNSRPGKESVEGILKAADMFKVIKYWMNSGGCYNTCMERYNSLQNKDKGGGK